MGSKRGVSLLLEAVLGFGIFASALLVIFALFPSTYQSTTLAKNLTIANGIAQEVMEQERSQPFLNIVSKPRVPFPAPASVIDGVVSNVDFNVEVTVLNDPLPTVPFRKHLVVRVDWADARIVHEVVLETYAVE